MFGSGLRFYTNTSILAGILIGLCWESAIMGVLGVIFIPIIFKIPRKNSDTTKEIEQSTRSVSTVPQNIPVHSGSWLPQESPVTDAERSTSELTKPLQSVSLSSHTSDSTLTASDTSASQRYCKLCGAPLNNDRKCTGCGKQYFHIKKDAWLKFYAFCITLVLVVFVCENYRNTENANAWMNLYNEAHGQIDEINKVLEDSHISREGLFHNVGRIYSFSKKEWIENPAPRYETLTTPQIVETLISSYFKQKEEIIHWLGEIS